MKKGEAKQALIEALQAEREELVDEQKEIKRKIDLIDKKIGSVTLV